MRARAILACLLATLAALGLAGCGGGTDDAPAASGTPAEEATLVLDWFPNPNHAGIYTALSDNLVTARGVDLTVIPPSETTAALTQVAAGKADFAVSYQPEVILARSQGVPVVAVGALVTHPLNAVIARADSGVRRARDLEGRTVGIAGVPSDRPLLDTVVRADGGRPGEVRTRNVGFSLAPALAAGRVDAVIGAYWNVEEVELRRRGLDVRVLRLEENGVPDYDELVLVTSDSVLQKRPDVVRAVLGALAEGQSRAVADQAAAVDALMAANPDLDPEVTVQQLALTAPVLIDEGSAPLTLDPAAWRRFIAWMTREGLLTKPVDVGAVVDPGFLETSRP